jgi:cytochrome bd-type quinol oxidase subunit 1
LAFLGTDPLRQRKDDRVSVLGLPWWQFSVTTVYHFLFAPIAVGAGSVIGDMAGIMTEFESGINWSAYSPMIGSVRAAGVLRAPAR